MFRILQCVLLKQLEKLKTFDFRDCGRFQKNPQRKVTHNAATCASKALMATLFVAKLVFVITRLGNKKSGQGNW